MFSRYPGSVQVIFRVPGPTPLSGESVNQAEVVRALHVPSAVVVICIAEVSDTLTVVSVLSTVSCEDESPPPGPSLMSPQLVSAKVVMLANVSRVISYAFITVSLSTMVIVYSYYVRHGR